jgi:hypothetical protein
MTMTLNSLGRLAVRALGIGGFAAGLALGSAASAQVGPPPPPPPVTDEASQSDEAPRRARPARVRTSVTPYLEVNAVIGSELGGGDVFTYTSVAAGVDGRAVTRRVSAQVSYRYERRIELEGDIPDNDAHSGVALVSLQVVPGILNFDAGALATQTGGAGLASGFSTGQAATRVYSAYAGPSLSTRVGEVAVNAAYRLGYVHIDDGFSDFTGGSEDYDSATAHNASASAGMAPGRLPFGWTVGAGYSREDSGELENRFSGYYVRGDVVLPVGPTLALTAGVGYENIESTQLDIQRDSGGLPIVDAFGRLVADRSRPRLSAYDQSGLIYDAGVIWRPSSRTELQARAGRRYGGTTVTGSLQHQFNSAYGMSASVYDSVGTFGNAIINNVSQLPNGFSVERNPLTGALNTCVFGTDPGSGVCFDQALQTLSSATYRSRGGNLVFSGSRGLWDFGVGLGYANNRYFALQSGDFSSVQPRTDESYSLNGTLGRRLSRTAGIDFNAYASRYDSDRLGFAPVFSTGVTAGYHQSFLLDRMQLHAALGISHFDGGIFDSTSASALLGLRYHF